MKTCKVYGNGTVYLGKAAEDNGFVGQSYLITMPGALVIVRPGASVGELRRSIELAMTEFELAQNKEATRDALWVSSDKRTVASAFGLIARMAAELAGEVEILRNWAVDESKVKISSKGNEEREVRKMLGLDGSDEVEHDVEVDTEHGHEHETGVV